MYPLWEYLQGAYSRHTSVLQGRFLCTALVNCEAGEVPRRAFGSDIALWHKMSNPVKLLKIMEIMDYVRFVTETGQYDK